VALILFLVTVIYNITLVLEIKVAPPAAGTHEMGTCELRGTNIVPYVCDERGK